MMASWPGPDAAKQVQSEWDKLLMLLIVKSALTEPTYPGTPFCFVQFLIHFPAHVLVVFQGHNQSVHQFMFITCRRLERRLCIPFRLQRPVLCLLSSDVEINAVNAVTH